MMASNELVLTLDVPGLLTAPSPEGGHLIWAVGPDRSFFAVLRSIPGRLVYARQTSGVRTATGWAAVDTDDEAAAKVAELLVGVATVGGGGRRRSLADV